MNIEDLNEIMDWCTQKLAYEKANPFGLTGRKLEGYEQAMKSVISYLHNKKTQSCRYCRSYLEEDGGFCLEFDRPVCYTDSCKLYQRGDYVDGV